MSALDRDQETLKYTAKYIIQLIKMFTDANGKVDAKSLITVITQLFLSDESDKLDEIE